VIDPLLPLGDVAAGDGTVRPDKRARAAVLTCFVVHGLVLASWTPRIPAVKARLSMSNGVLGLTLLGAPLGARLAMPLAGALSSRVGSRSVTRASLLLYCCAAALVGLARSPVELFGSLFVWGVGLGAAEVALNVQGAAVEVTYGRPIMATFHGGWSIGALLGALLGSALAAAHVSLLASLGGAGLGGLVVVAVAQTHLLKARGEGGRAFARPSRALLLLGGIAFASYLAEGAVADWSSVYLRDELSAAAGVAGLGYAAFAVTMTTGRMGGGRLVGRFGAGPTIRVSACFGALVLAGALLAGDLPAAIVGFAALGLGLAVVVPSVLTAAARRSGGIGTSPALAAISTCGIAGYLIGPPIIGGVADAISLPVALGLLPLLAAVIALLAGGIDRRGA
jgi:fucose permease